MLPRLNSVLLTFMGVFLALCLLHAPLLRLPYFWDEAGYYIPAALDLSRHGLLVPQSTLPTGHTPLLSVYLAVMWRLFGSSPFVTRAALVLVAALTVAAFGAFASCGVQGEAKREVILWSALCLVLSPLFFAQSSLAHPEILVTLFTTLAVAALLTERMVAFAVIASLAVLSKETAAILLTVAWLFAWRRKRERRLTAWIALAFPVLPLLAWTIYYHHATGFWTGNAEYLEYNLYTTLNPLRFLLALLRRIWGLFGAGFNWVLVLAAGFGVWAGRGKGEGKRTCDEIAPLRPDLRKGSEAVKKSDLTGLARTFRCAFSGDRRTYVDLKAFASRFFRTFAAFPYTVLNTKAFRLRRLPESCKLFSRQELQRPVSNDSFSASEGVTLQLTGDFTFLAVGLCAVYVVMLSLVGGAILSRYLLPVFPVFYLSAVTFIWRLPRALARTACTLAAACLIGSWFINPPYPFPFENNLAYADFIRLHEQAAHFLENSPADPLVLTAWPASGELTIPTLGYVRKALHVTTVRGFAFEDFADISAESFDLLYLYSRRWEPENSWLARSALLRRIQGTYFGYAPQIPQQELVDRYHLRLLVHLKRRGQWVRIYTRH
jgi:hypothetical protein